MPLTESRVISLSIDCPFSEAYNFLRMPENFSQWASGLGQSLKERGGVWSVETPEGPAEIRFTPRNDFGVLDHFVCPEAGGEIYVPMRVIANGDGCDVMLTLFRQPSMSDDRFEQDAEWVLRDLGNLKSLLES